MGYQDTLRKSLKIDNDLFKDKFNYKIIFSYDGTSFYGYQKQINKRSIEEEIENKLSLVFNLKIKIYASSRTDKGVHALNQVANFFLDKKIEDTYSLNDFKYKINKLLDKNIFIKSIKRVSYKFSSRYNVKSKEYFYLINYKEYDPFKKNYEVFIPNLNIERFKEASFLFLGSHDFRNFTSKKDDELLNFKRTINYIKIIKENNKRIKIYFNADGFMRYEIRKIVGTLIAYSFNKIDKVTILKYLNNEFNERKIISFQAPPQGLYLNKVNY